jgi:hypothetical protein
MALNGSSFGAASSLEDYDEKALHPAHDHDHDTDHGDDHDDHGYAPAHGNVHVLGGPTHGIPFDEEDYSNLPPVVQQRSPGLGGDIGWNSEDEKSPDPSTSRGGNGAGAPPKYRLE